MGQLGRWERILKLPPGTLKAEELAQVVRQLLTETSLKVGATETKRGEVSEAPRKRGAAGKVRL